MTEKNVSLTVSNAQFEYTPQLTFKYTPMYVKAQNCDLMGSTVSTPQESFCQPNVQVFSVWSLHDLLLVIWVFSRCEEFLLQPKGNSGLLELLK